MLTHPLKPGVISVNNKRLAWLSPKTETAFQLGNLKKQYKLLIGEKTFDDVMDAFWFYAQEIEDTYTASTVLMIDLLYNWLKMYPNILNSITLCGGKSWLSQCTYKSDEYSWDGYGYHSRYIRCMIEAYEVVVDETNRSKRSS